MIGEDKKERTERLNQIEIKSLTRLQENKIQYRQCGEYHFKVDHNGHKFDYWPRTGLFINSKTKKRGRGVFNLLKILKKGDSK